jgi:mandelate racemase
LEYVDWASPILAEPLVPKNGEIVAVDKPGIGIAWDEKAVTKYAISI